MRRFRPWVQVLAVEALSVTFDSTPGPWLFSRYLRRPAVLRNFTSLAPSSAPTIAGERYNAKEI